MNPHRLSRHKTGSGNVLYLKEKEGSALARRKTKRQGVRDTRRILRSLDIETVVPEMAPAAELSPLCLVRAEDPHAWKKGIRGRRETPEVFQNQQGEYIAQGQNYDCEWILRLSPRAYEAWERGDKVFDSYWGDVTAPWETEVEVLYYAWCEDY